MKYYIYSFIAVAVAGALLLVFDPGTVRTKKQFKLIVSLCMLSVLIAPLKDAYISWNEIKGDVIGMFDIKTIKDNEDTKYIAPTMIIEETKIKLEEEVKEMIIQKFGFSNDAVYIDTELDTKDVENIKILWIRAKIKEDVSGGTRPSQIAEYLSHELGVPAEVEFE